jgi:hypothetical protein
MAWLPLHPPLDESPDLNSISRCAAHNGCETRTMDGAASKEDDCKNVGSIIGPMNSFNDHLPDELRTGYVVSWAR